ncbi:MAG: energy-coupling factor transporter transmembrane protein EcfT [Clostridia bacterium]|nr:energy-coupling factor transporter transmembrane protein EcfT [Clostridia bacterium]
MIKDITLGQYLPGNSPVHRMDPRTKIVIIFAYIIVLFTVKNPVGYAVCTLFPMVVCALAKIPFKMIAKSLKPLLFFIIFTAVINLFLTNGEIVFSFWVFKITKEGIVLTVKMALRLILLVAGTSILTYTTSPIVLTDGIEKLLSPLSKIGVPAHEIAMMMTIALRFIPTIIDETDKIMKAQSARGSDFESGNLIRRAKALIPILVPLFISAFKRADDLAVAMECRCYHGGKNRTKLKTIKMTGLDLVAVLVSTAVFAAVLIWGR